MRDYFSLCFFSCMYDMLDHGVEEQEVIEKECARRCSKWID